jgi:DNA gyrase subunit A
MADEQERQAESIASGARYLLEKSRLRFGILRAVLSALDQFETVTAVIRASEDSTAARGELMRVLDIDEQQAQAVAALQIMRLARRDHQRIAEESDEMAAMIADLEGLLASPERVRELIGTERGDYLAGQISA